MDQKITAAFFDVSPRNDGVPAIVDVLRAAYAQGPLPADRRLELSGDVKVRLERLADNGEWVEGEMARIQTENIPPEAFADGLKPSRAKSQGHSAVFRYMPRTGLLVIQKNTSGMTYSRFFRYLRKFDDTARYDAEPLAGRDVWGRFGAKKPKRFSITLADVTNPEAVEGPVGAITDSTRRVGNALDGPTVHIAVSSGGKDQGLDKGALKKILEYFTKAKDEEPGFEVTSLSVTAETEEGDASEVINFLDDFLKESEEILLDGLSSDESYARRIRFLRDCYVKHMDYIMNLYGKR